ncbi:histidine phosphatase family protein [Acinetobacter bereziniae]|uniref:histidine phosphatase family protein n=1 Tax=Acinetobacter bereziniae TaxID=106648 RepID=UPI0021CD882E|nr:histidine phosphatase family protein [Acinetobacter bereziniae]MCU4535645.1 histidine phosphatase family protein [Acinetobacter bereziniae]
MKLRVDLLRHGETTLSHTLRGSTDDDLTELGWQQMQQSIFLDQNSVQTQWDYVFSSPLKRCAQFAQSFSQQVRIPLMQDQRLQEIHFGDWEGISVQQIYTDSPELLANFWQYPTRFTPPNAEKYLDFQSRINQALYSIQQHMLASNSQTALVVTHGGVIKLLKCMALQQSLDDILKMTADLGQLNRFILDSETMQLELLEDGR